MAKVTPDDLTAMQFVPEMFGESSSTFDAFLTGIINEQADLLEGRIGSAAYSATAKPAATYANRAEKCLVAAELYQLRFNRISGEIQTVDGMDAFKLRRTRQEYLDEAEKLIARVVSGGGADGGDAAFGCMESSHFDEAAADA